MVVQLATLEQVAKLVPPELYADTEVVDVDYVGKMALVLTPANLKATEVETIFRSQFLTL